MARQGLVRIAVACAALAVLALPASAQAAPYAKRTLKVGSKGSDVKLLQKYLNSVGLDTKVDGTYGRATATAVKKFEQAAHKRADGKASASDQRAIKQAAIDGDSLDSVAGGTGGASYEPDAASN